MNSDTITYLDAIKKQLKQNPVAQKIASTALSSTTDRPLYFPVDASTAKDMDEAVSYLNHPEKLGLDFLPGKIVSARYFEEKIVEVCFGDAEEGKNSLEQKGIYIDGRITRFRVAFIAFRAYTTTYSNLGTEAREKLLADEWNASYGEILGPFKKLNL